LGSFGNQGPREVAIPQSIDQDYWFQIGTRRIYPGYEKCFADIKHFVQDFVHELTGFDVNSQAAFSEDEQDSRAVSQNISEDESYDNIFQDPVQWGPWKKESGFEMLSRAVSNCKYSFDSMI
jgi:hypothetical protein